MGKRRSGDEGSMTKEAGWTVDRATDVTVMARARTGYLIAG
jgi:hypothetical protein